MFKPLKILGVILFLLAMFPGVTHAAPAASNLTLNGGSNDVIINPTTEGSNVSIELTASESVKWSTIAICQTSDTACSRTTAAKYFTSSTSFSTNVSKIWNGKNSKNEAVVDGQYKIKVTLKNEKDESGETDFSSPLIIVSSSAQVNVQNNNEIEENNSNSSSGNTSASQTATKLSAHASPTEVSTGNPTLAWKISAGRERLVLAGAPVTFRAKTVSGSQSNPNFSWTFGDGGTTYGELVKHTFLKPGKYQVVLNGLGSGEDAVARTVVTAVEPKIDLKINSASLDITIKNNQIAEVNVGGFRLIATSTQIFELPPDTLIGAQEEIILDRRLTKLEPTGELLLASPHGEVIAAARPEIKIEPVVQIIYQSEPVSVGVKPTRKEEVASNPEAIILDRPKSSPLAKWFSWFKLFNNL